MNLSSFKDVNKQVNPKKLCNEEEEHTSFKSIIFLIQQSGRLKAEIYT